MKILNYGSLNIDYVYKVDHIVEPGETLSSEGMEIFCGGKGLNQSIALTRAGVEVYHAGKIGKDAEGTLLLETCKKNHVDTTHLTISDEKSGHTIIQVDKNGQNSILLFGGSNQRQEQIEINDVLNQFSQGDFLLLQNEINNLDYIIEKASEKGMNIVVNPSPFNTNLKKCDLSKVTYFILNEIEAEQMTGKSNPNEMLEDMLIKFPDAKIVLTLGEKGSIYKDKKEEYRQAIFLTNVVDTTAAGDTFTGYFLAGIIQGTKYPEALSLAAKAASIAVSRAGAANSIPEMQEVTASMT